MGKIQGETVRKFVERIFFMAVIFLCAREMHLMELEMKVLLEREKTPVTQICTSPEIVDRVIDMAERVSMINDGCIKTHFQVQERLINGSDKIRSGSGLPDQGGSGRRGTASLFGIGGGK